MSELAGKVVWVTGAGSGIGEAAARALGADGAAVVLTGRRREPLEKVAVDIRESGGAAHVQPGDLTQAGEAGRIVAWIKQSLGRLDIFVNSAGLNIPNRAWSDLTPESAELVLAINLNAAFSCALAVLPIMREQKDGLLIHVSSWSGRIVERLSGGAYSAAKHGVVAMSQSINMEECVNGIRSCALCPGEVETPILDKRPRPVSAEDRARMLRPADIGSLVSYIARLPPRVCINEVLISPTWNRAYVLPLQIKL